MSISSVTSTRKINYKIVMLGNSNVGKSSIIQKYIYDRFDGTANPTICIDFMVKNNLIYKSKQYKLHIWDTAGQQRYQSLIPSYLKGSHCAIIVYDVDNKQSFLDIKKWLNVYRQEKSELQCVVIVGNKIDLGNRSVSKQEGETLGKELGIKYFQVSAKLGKKLNQLFELIIDLINSNQIVQNQINDNEDNMNKDDNNNTKNKQQQQIKIDIHKLDPKKKKKNLKCC